MSKILFIFEGEKIEKQCFDLISKLYLKHDSKPKEYISYKTNIYSLFKEINDDYGLSVIEIIKKRAYDLKDWYTYTTLEKGNFSQIYLVFDLDPQDSNYSPEKITEMINLFDNETENGKLYINYPMAESIKHFQTLPDANYNSYTVDISSCPSYKDLINKISIILDIKKLTYNDFKTIILQNLSKFEFISSVRKIETYRQYTESISQIKIFNVEKKFLDDGKVSVLNSFCFWPLEYYGEKFFNKLTK